jgi:transketolase
VLPAACARRVTVEAASTFGWERYAGGQGLLIGLNRFGDSAPAKKLAEVYGFTAAAIAERVKGYLA